MVGPTTSGRQSTRLRLPVRCIGSQGHGQHHLVAAVRRPGARRPDRRGARPQLGVRIAAANVEAAAAVLTQTRAPLFPQIGYSGQGLRERFSEDTTAPVPGSFRNPRSELQVLAGASWEIDLWGRVRRQSEGGARAAARHGRGTARRDPVLWARWPAATSSSSGSMSSWWWAKKTQGAYKESLRLFELQFKHGQVSEMAVAQARSQYETATAQIPGIERQIAKLEECDVHPSRPNPGPIARGKTIKTLAGPAIPVGLRPSSWERRPDILQAEQQLIAANALIGRRGRSTSRAFR